jgi:hypothetical protein
MRVRPLHMCKHEYIYVRVCEILSISQPFQPVWRPRTIDLVNRNGFNRAEQNVSSIVVVSIVFYFSIFIFIFLLLFFVFPPSRTPHVYFMHVYYMHPI